MQLFKKIVDKYCVCNSVLKAVATGGRVNVVRRTKFRIKNSNNFLLSPFLRTHQMTINCAIVSYSGSLRSKRILLLQYCMLLCSPILLSGLVDYVGGEFPHGYPPIEWVHINDSPLWIYGAFFDDRARNGHNLEDIYAKFYVIGPNKYKDFVPKLEKSSCEFSYSDPSFNRSVVKVSWVQAPSCDWYSPNAHATHFYVYCNIPLTKSLPVSVSLIVNDHMMRKWKSDNEGRRRDFLIPIRGAKNLEAHQLSRKLSMCVKPFLGNWAVYGGSGYFEPIELIINFFIYYSSVGVDHFVLYDQGTAPGSIYKIIELAKSAGISIEVFPWNIHERYGFGMFQTLSIEACLHRFLNMGENVIVVRSYYDINKCNFNS